MGDSIYAYVLVQLQLAKGESGKKGGWPDVSKRSGVPLRTLEKIARREVKDPRISSIEKLAAYFRRKAA